jgi:hypothetical protein
MTLLALCEVLNDYVEAGGEIDEVKETRSEWSMHAYHYDMRPRVIERLLYMETRLLYKNPDHPDDPQIHVVNVHWA